MYRSGHAVLGVVVLLLVACLSGYVLYSIYWNKSAAKEDARQVGKNRPLLIVGEVWAPFEYEGKDGQLTGIDVDVFDIIFSRLKVPYELKLYPWSRAQMMAENGDVDMVVSVSYKKSRERFLIYTESQKEFGKNGIWPKEYLWNSEYVFFCKKIFADKINFTSYDQLKGSGYRIGTVRDYSYNPEFIKFSLSSYVASDIEAGFKLLAEGRYELFPADKTVGLATLKKLGLDQKITYLPKVMFKKPYLMPACKRSDYPDLKNVMAQFYEELNKLRQSGEYKKIYDRYTTIIKTEE
jgi:polar amino acid transport system substrate-binding protein